MHNIAKQQQDITIDVPVDLPQRYPPDRPSHIGLTKMLATAQDTRYNA
jgi:hypothetical protein